MYKHIIMHLFAHTYIIYGVFGCFCIFPIIERRILKSILLGLKMYSIVREKIKTTLDYLPNPTTVRLQANLTFN